MGDKIKPYKIQIEYSQKAYQILNKKHMVIFNFEMQIGKTITSFETCRLMGYKKVLFVTLKKIIPSIQKQSELFQTDEYYDLDIINYDSLHKIKGKYDCVIVDESHRLGSFPKPSQRQKRLRALSYDADIIYLTGTLTPESWSQIFHQLHISKHNPYDKYRNFYKWANDGYVDIKKVYRGAYLVNDYSNASIDMIKKDIYPILLTVSQDEGGFVNSQITEKAEIVDMKKSTYDLIKTLVKDRYTICLHKGVQYDIACETAVSLQQKIHQICSGTLKLTDKIRVVLDYNKALWIREYFIKNKKPIVIFYKYIAEKDMLKKVFKNAITECSQEFNEGKKDIYISQVRSGSLGINVSRSDIIIALNIDFSAELYIQMKARIQHREKTRENTVIWLFAKDGIEEKIYERVKKKQNFSSIYFKKDFLRGLV